LQRRYIYASSIEKRVFMGLSGEIPHEKSMAVQRHELSEEYERDLKSIKYQNP
jgi:hypothetical protein